jgi:hypothetical protein
VAAIYHALYRQGKRWGIPADPAHTPREYAVEFLNGVSGQLAGQRGAVLESIEGDLGLLTVMYNRLTYSSRRLTPLDHHQAVRTWYHLRRQLTWLWLREMVSVRKR